MFPLPLVVNVHAAKLYLKFLFPLAEVNYVYAT